jgi:hypothetical protein
MNGEFATTFPTLGRAPLHRTPEQKLGMPTRPGSSLVMGGHCSKPGSVGRYGAIVNQVGGD